MYILLFVGESQTTIRTQEAFHLDIQMSKSWKSKEKFFPCTKYMGTWIHGYMSTWVHGYMGTWVHGYMGTWVHGYMGTWVHGYITDRKIIYWLWIAVTPIIRIIQFDNCKHYFNYHTVIFMYFKNILGVLAVVSEAKTIAGWTTVDADLEGWIFTAVNIDLTS